MTVTITFTDIDPAVVLSDMAKMLGFTKGLSVPAVSDVSSDSVGENTTNVETDKPVGLAPRPRRVRPAKTTPPDIEATATSVTTEPQQAISTGEEREPVAEEAQPEDVKTYTMEDVRNAATPYIKKHTMAFAQLDLQDCLEAAVGIRQISKLNPADQAQLKKAIDAFDAAGKAEARFMKVA